nr:hypothetical protein [Mycoplasmopsis bovis]
MKNFKEDKEIYSFDKLWDRIDNELREQALMQIFILVSDLLQMDKNIEWVKLNAYERAEAIRDIYKEFKDWILKDLENYLSAYDKDDFIDEKKIKKRIRKTRSKRWKNKSFGYVRRKMSNFSLKSSSFP